MLIAFLLIVIHYVCDFILQDEEWALNKKHSFKHLLNHTIFYSLAFSFPIAFVMMFDKNITGVNLFISALVFTVVSFIFHTATDLFTSKWVGDKFARKHLGSKIPNFGAFTAIGFDQVLHYAQLFLTYYLITK